MSKVIPASPSMSDHIRWAQKYESPLPCIRELEADEKPRLKGEGKEYILFMDGYGANGFEFRLTDVGAYMIRVAYEQLPVSRFDSRFWGYNFPLGEDLWSNEERAGDLTIHLRSRDKAALVAVGKLLSDFRCWRQPRR